MTKADQPGIFRRAALERLSSPEKLDQPVALVRPRSWLVAPTVAAAGLIIWLARTIIF